MSIILPQSKSKLKSANGLAYSHNGEGMPVVFIHGVGLRSESWYQQVDAFKNDYSVFTLDMPGHGESDLFDKDKPTLADFTEKVAQFIIDVVKQPAVIVGHSMGALLSLSLAKEYPELCLAIVPMNAIYQRSNEAKAAVKLRASQLNELTHADACAPISRWFGDLSGVDSSLSEQDEYHAQLCRDWLLDANLDGYAAAYKVFAEEDGPSTSTLSKLKMPVMYLTGDLDLNSNVAMTLAMAKVTPQAKAVIIKNSRHMTPLTHANEVNAEILKFLQKRLEKKEIKHD